MKPGKAEFDVSEHTHCFHDRQKRTTLATCGLLAMLGVVWLGLAMAWAAAGGRWWQTASSWNGWEVAGVGLMLLWSATVAIGLHWVAHRWGNRCFIAAAVLLTLLAGTGWAWATRGMENWPMDSGLFRWFLERLVAGGFSVENLRMLAGVYDYPVWTRRSLPFCLLLYQWAGPEHFAWVVQLAQAAMCAAGVALAWRVAGLLCGEKAAHWITTAIVAMPGYTLQVVGLNHQVWGSFWFLTGWWLLAEWTFGEGGTKCKAGLAVAACMLVPVVRLAGFAGTMYLLCAVCVLLFGLVHGSAKKRQAVWALVWLVAVPSALSEAILQPLSRQMAEANPVPIRGGQLAFAARGWDCQEWGEYVADGEWLDVLTPPEWKTHLFLKYIAGQCTYHGRTLAARLFPAKLAKFMLAGYASLAEEVLWANGAERTGRVARGMRVGWFVLLYAPLMLWGLWRLARRVGDGDGRVAWLVLPVALFAVGVMFAGETSPRYSMPVQALLLAAGACGLAGSREELDGTEMGLKHPFAWGLGLVAVVYLIFSSTLIGLRGVWERYALADMRTAMLEAGHPDENPFQAPFEAIFPDGAGSVAWPGNGGSATAYLRGPSWRSGGTAEVECPSGTWQTIGLPARVELRWDEDTPRRVAVRRISGDGPLHLGYADLCPRD